MQSYPLGFAKPSGVCSKRSIADVAASAALAAAVARGARELVAVNLTALPGDARIEEADRLVAVADAAAARVAGA